TTIYGDFKTSDPFTVQILFPKQGRVQIVESKTQRAGEADAAPSRFPSETLITLPSGNSKVLIAAGSSVQTCLESVDRSLKTQNKEALFQTRRAWKARLSNLR